MPKQNEGGKGNVSWVYRSRTGQDRRNEKIKKRIQQNSEQQKVVSISTVNLHLNSSLSNGGSIQKS